MPARIIREQLRTDPVAHFLWTQTREGWTFVSADGMMQLVNPAFAKMLGYSVGELEGHRFSEFTFGRDVAPHEREFQRLLSGEIPEYHMVTSYNTKHRHTVTVKLRAIAYESGALVLGQVLPIDTLAIEHLPDHEAKRVMSMLVGRWVVETISEHWKRLLLVLLVLIVGSRFPDLIAMFKK